MTGLVAVVLTFGLYALIVCVILRALLSWFPTMASGTNLARFLDRVTGPLLEPVRRVVPPVGMIDLSSFIVIILLSLMLTVVQQATGS